MGPAARGVRLPLSTPLRYQPRFDIINGNAIFSGAVQFRVPLSRIRPSVLHVDLSISPPPPSPPTVRFLARVSFVLSVWSEPFIYLLPALPLVALPYASVILYTFRSSRSADRWMSILRVLHGFHSFRRMWISSRRWWKWMESNGIMEIINVTLICS